MNAIRHVVQQIIARSTRTTHTPDAKPRRVFNVESLEPRLVHDCLLITEFVASNQQGLQDEDGDRPDWVEISNNCETVQSLRGWHLTDDKSDKDKWTFPDVQLDANDQIVAFASDKNRTDPSSNLHTNFKLNRHGEYLALTSPDKVLIATEFDRYPPQRADVSYGFTENVDMISMDRSWYFQQPTPGTANTSTTYAGFVADVDVDVRRGFYDQPQLVTLTTATTGASIVYTTDGSLPSLTNGTVVNGLHPDAKTMATIEVASTAVLRAAAFKVDHLPSPTRTQTYIFPERVIEQDLDSALHAEFPARWGTVNPDYAMDPDVPYDAFDGLHSMRIAESLLSVPTVSLVLDVDDMFGDEGIYVNATHRGRDWERPTSVEFMYPNGAENNIQIDAGIRIHGGASRDHFNTLKKSFRLAFRSEYGPSKLEARLFGSEAATQFDSLILRAGFNDSWQDFDTEERAQYIRDEWYRRTQLAMGNASAHGFFAHVYINGLYWGLYNVVERPDDDFSSSYSGGDKDEWDVVKKGRAIDGTDEAWNKLLELAAEVDTTDQAASNLAFRKILGINQGEVDKPNAGSLLDVNNYIDYMILNLYGGTTDWPGNNWYATRQRGPNSSGFKFYTWDAEISLGYGTFVQANHLSVRNGVAEIYHALRANEEFRRMFADRVQKHFFEGGALHVESETPNCVDQHSHQNLPAARYSDLADEVELALIAESARWGDQHRSDGPYSLADWQSTRDQLLLTYFPHRSAAVLSQFVAAGLYPSLDAPRFNKHGGQVPSGFELRMEASGNIIYTLDGSDPWPSSLLGPAPELSENAIRYTGPMKLANDVVVNARTYVNGQWSALTQSRFTVSSVVDSSTIDSGPNAVCLSQDDEISTYLNGGAANGDDYMRSLNNTSTGYVFADRSRDQVKVIQHANQKALLQNNSGWWRSHSNSERNFAKVARVLPFDMGNIRADVERVDHDILAAIDWLFADDGENWS